MIDKTMATIQKLRGGYYTPNWIADYLWCWVNESRPLSVLEPSAGDGSLIRPIMEGVIQPKVCAIELLKSESEKIKQRFQSTENVSVINSDFYEWYSQYHGDLFEGMVSNPPYIRFQYLSEKQRLIQSDILKRNGLKSNKLINAWVAFVVASLELMAPSARVAFVLPTDLLQVSYAKELRQFLLRRLSELSLITFEKTPFTDLEQNTLLVLGQLRAKDDSNSDTIFKHVAVKNKELPRLSEVDPADPPNVNADKWNDLFLTNDDNRIVKYIVAEKSVAFSSVAKAEVGVTTGANSFFSLTKKQVISLNAKDFVTPLLGRSVSVEGLSYSSQTQENNDKANRKDWLLTLGGNNYQELPSNLKRYISEAESAQINTAYKLRIRTNWYKIPGVWIPDAFLLRRIGQIPRMILNEYDAVSTDTFHRVRFIEGVNSKLIIFAFYSSLTLMSLELAGRQFAGGALEVLPGDTNHVRLPDINYHRGIGSEKLNQLDDLLRKGLYNEATNYVDCILSLEYGASYEPDVTKRILQILRSRRIN
ncbi:Modification methylase Eco57IB (plasmid) [Levilactobacillus brevis KB290]|uniref:site-specific DNA-methyltransferase (adenine-specific) n=1 Tax=Levilactobacillus brevis KB290 TaxID=1001583 RepID=M5AI28_LEVBR|nr:restriction endonuclease subunit M [Levilactobacillus brevis]BAN08060.1 Modification methylase Eco57IB [Levilactobacillus brevis KB290]